MSKKLIVILVAQGVQDQEFFYPYYRLQEEKDFEIVVASPNCAQPITGKYGIPIKPDINTNTLEQTCGDAAGIVIPGGWQCPEILRCDASTLAYINKHHATAVIGAICHGPQVLISADILKGRRATCYAGMRMDLINAGAIYLDKPVVSSTTDSGIMVTAQHYRDNPDFVKTFIDRIHDPMAAVSNIDEL